VEIQIEQKDQTDDWNCPQCSQALDPSFLRCPHCALELKRSCVSCRQVLQSDWPLCPYCGTANSTRANALELLDGKVAVQTIGFLPSPSSGTIPIQLEKKSRHNKILVVDDVELNRRVAAKALEKLPLQPEVIEAKDGFEALRLIKSEKPDLILLDLMMPGMSGFEVCRKIREDVETAFIPIIMLTASTTEEHRVEGYLTGTDDYMTKPFVVADLHARVTRAFRRTYGI
jgi:CheY-like chemotaxis protein